MRLERAPEKPPACGNRRSANSKITCELPDDHPTGWQYWHMGRGAAGQWYSWPVESEASHDENRS